MQYDIDGVFLGDVDGDQAAADIQIEVHPAGARWTIRKLGSKGQPAVVESGDPIVRFWQLQVHHMIRQLAGQGSPQSSAGEAPVRSGLPRQAVCPACLGIEPEKWDCELCDGGGVVPA